MKTAGLSGTIAHFLCFCHLAIKLYCIALCCGVCECVCVCMRACVSSLCACACVCGGGGGREEVYNSSMQDRRQRHSDHRADQKYGPQEERNQQIQKEAMMLI